MTAPEITRSPVGAGQPRGLRPLSVGRRLALALVVVVAVVLQTSFFSHLAWRGVVPDLAMLVVLAVALVRGPMTGMLLGFAAGLLLDLAPPSDHVAGRWALALVVVGALAGQLGVEQRLTAAGRVALVAACSFVATSIVSLTGLLVDDVDYSFTDLVTVVLIALVLDVVASAFVLGWVSRIAGRESERSRRPGFALRGRR